jgi:hypothetical protein
MLARRRNRLYTGENMATNPATPLSPDAAYSAFKTVEGQLTTDTQTLTGANAALTQAQATASNAGEAVATDQTNAVQAAQAVINAMQNFVAANTPATQAPTSPAQAGL